MPRREDGARVVEFELRGRHWVLLAVLLVGAVAAVLLGLWRQDRRSSAAPAPGAPAPMKDVADEETLFDRADPAVPPTRQRSALGPAPAVRFELDLGGPSSRGEAEALRERVQELGFAACTVRDAGGGQRVAVGPFAEEGAARHAAARLERLLGRPVRLRALPSGR